MDVKNYNELMNTAMSLFVSNQDAVTDFNDGSVIKTLFEAFCRIVERAYIDTRNGYNSILQEIIFSIFGFKKKSGTRASVNLIFSTAENAKRRIEIPSGVEVSDGTHKFITTSKGFIETGSQVSNTITAEAENIGVDYNVKANAINTILTIVPSEIVEVTNPIKSDGGNDEETNAQVLARFKAMINGLQGTNTYGLEAGILAIESVRSISIQEHFPLQDGFNATVYVDDGTGNLTTELKNKVLDKINGDDVTPGLRPTGINIDVQAAVPVPISIDCKCYVYRVEEEYIKTKIKEVLQETVNNLGIGDDVVLTDIILALKNIEGIKDVSELTLNDSVANVSIGINQIARFEVATPRIEAWT